MKLILDLALKAFPPRLPEQPIFYPVLNKSYADQIAKEWNTKDRFSGFVGFVTAFKVRSPFIDQYDEQIVGATKHKELWIPAEDLEELNTNIEDRIQVIDIFYGADYEGIAIESEPFEGRSFIDQLKAWHSLYEYNSSEFYNEIQKQWKHIFINYKYWGKLDTDAVGLSEKQKNKVLLKMKEYWNERFVEIPLLEK